MAVGDVVVICSLGLFLLIHFAQAQESEVTKVMKSFKVIPEVITTGPKDFLKVTFANGIVADKGAELTPTQVKVQPTKVEWKGEKDAFYTLLLIDADAPSRSGRSKQWNHWLVGNIPVNDISKGDILAQYVGSAPPEKSGLHRYVFLLFKQPKKLEFTEVPINNTTAKGRPHFSTEEFAKKYSLGAPIAGNIYQAQWDKSVPEIYKQLGF